MITSTSEMATSPLPIIRSRYGSAFWRSVRVSRLCLVVSDWSFYYVLDDETLRVTEVRRK